MRLLPVAVSLLAWSALADDTQGVEQPKDRIVVELPTQGFRLSGSFDLGTVSALGDDLAAQGAGIPSNESSSELRSWRLPETFGYYPRHRDGGVHGVHAVNESGAERASNRRSRF